jgi:membrane protein YdbS with pleckstrin-like domain
MQEVLFFIIPFFLFHLAPVWIWLASGISASRKQKNIEYAVTSTRVLIRSGFIGVNFQSIYYKEISNVSIKVGVIDKLFGVGDVAIQAQTKATMLYDLKDIYDVFKRIEKIVRDIQTDIEYPNALRPEGNPGYNTKYNGR